MLRHMQPRVAGRARRPKPGRGCLGELSQPPRWRGKQRGPARPATARVAGLMRTPHHFFEPLAIGAPDPVREVPFKPSRMIHFLDFSNEKMAAKAADIAAQTDILLGNLEDAVPVDRKEAARAGLIKVAKEADLGETALWTRVNSLESPWVLDD